MKFWIKNILGILIISSIGLIIINQTVWISHSTIIQENSNIEDLRKSKNSFVCILSTSKRNYKIGEAPELSVEIINKTDSSVIMVGSLDGSDIGWRLPICEFSVNHQIFGNISRTNSRCGNVNDLRELDFKVVPINSSFNPFEKIDNYGYFSAYQVKSNQFLIPGIYQLKFFYSTKKQEGVYTNMENFTKIDDEMKEWYFKEGKEELFFERQRHLTKIDSLWRLIPEIELESNTLTIKYEI